MSDLTAATNSIIEATEDGPLGEWNQRIGVVASFIGLRLCMIDWQGSPFMVAYRVAGEAKNQGWLDRVPSALDGYREYTEAEGKEAGR